jgi:hypothetical protein
LLFSFFAGLGFCARRPVDENGQGEAAMVKREARDQRIVKHGAEKREIERERELGLLTRGLKR